MFKITKATAERLDSFEIKEFKDAENELGEQVSVVSHSRNIRREDIVREIEQSDNQIKSIGEQKAKSVAILKDIDALTAVK